MSTPPESSRGDRRVGRYRILGFLGSGAMGDVYLAEDPHIERKLAIKTVRLDQALLDPRSTWHDPEADLSFAFYNNGYPAAGYDIGRSGRNRSKVVSMLGGDILDAVAARELHVQVAGDLAHVEIPVFEFESGRARHHFEPLHARECIDQLFRHRFAQVIRGRIAGQVRERQNCDGSARRRGPCSASRTFANLCSGSSSTSPPARTSSRRTTTAQLPASSLSKDGRRSAF